MSLCGRRGVLLTHPHLLLPPVSFQACQLPRNPLHSITSRGRQSPSLPTAFWELLHPGLRHLHQIQAIPGKVRIASLFRLRNLMTAGHPSCPGNAHVSCRFIGFLTRCRSPGPPGGLAVSIKISGQAGLGRTELSLQQKFGCHFLDTCVTCLNKTIAS